MPGTTLMRYSGLGSSSRSDQRILFVLSRLQTGALLLIGAIAGTVFAGWVCPALARSLPVGWNQMKANTALLILLCGASLVFSQNGRSSRLLRAGSVLGLLVFGIAALTCAQFFGLVLLPIDTLFAPDPSGIVPGRMSLQASMVFMIMGLVFSGIRIGKNVLSSLVDLGALLLVLFMLSFIGDLLLHRAGTPGRALRLQLAPQSFVCLGLLTLLIFYRRSEHGLFSILVDAGIGGKMARLALPVAILLPLSIGTMQEVVVRYGLMSVNYALAVVPALMSIVAFCLILSLANRSRQLEHAARELSLLDELTGLYNRRGFMALAGQALRNSVRRGEPFSVLFIDVDDLKLVNDEQGHDVGSDLLQDVARLLRDTFRESDLLGRLGGDEFVVAANDGAAQMALAIDRLRQAVDAMNATAGRRYDIGFSIGCVAREEDRESLERLIERADERMYEAKRLRKSRQVRYA